MRTDAEYDIINTQEAIDLGLEVVNADDYTLQLDIDSDADYNIFKDQFVRMMQRDLIFPAMRLGDKGWEEWRSKSGIGRHIQIKLNNPLPAEERILLQLLLGSDRMRETFNLSRVRQGIENPIRLFRPPPGWTHPKLRDTVDFEPINLDDLF